MAFRLNLLVALTGLLAMANASAQDASAPPVRLRGDIVSFAGDVLTIHRRGVADTVTVAVKPDLAIGALKQISLADIKPGTFIGTAATTGADGKLTALEVVVFPEAARGTGEGHYDWDLGPTTSMTNANVDAVVEGNNGRQLKLSYKGGNNEVTVPVGVPIVTFTGATRADLLAGKQVFIVATSAGVGQFSALRIVVEKDGVVPPM